MLVLALSFCMLLAKTLGEQWLFWRCGGSHCGNDFVDAGCADVGGSCGYPGSVVEAFFGNAALGGNGGCRVGVLCDICTVLSFDKYRPQYGNIQAALPSGDNRH